MQPIFVEAARLIHEFGAGSLSDVDKHLWTYKSAIPQSDCSILAILDGGLEDLCCDVASVYSQWITILPNDNLLAVHLCTVLV